MTNYNRCKDTHNHNSSFVIPLAGADRKTIRCREICFPGPLFCLLRQLAAFLQETGAGKNIPGHGSGVGNIYRPTTIGPVAITTLGAR
jgi:hypothetical protein